ncbi:MAG: hypothetical protein GX550_02395, partial [Syntrophomonadaceae bacterium]|nr:hypothetical protein [Syntrophomonadaceae bacterium]
GNNDVRELIYSLFPCTFFHDILATFVAQAKDKSTGNNDVRELIYSLFPGTFFHDILATFVAQAKDKSTGNNDVREPIILVISTLLITVE